MKNPVIIKAVDRYLEDFIQNGFALASAKNSLNSKLYEFSTDKSKFEFLNMLRDEVFAKLQEHIEICQMKNCQTQEGIENSLFVTDEELESLTKYYIPKYVGDDEFSANEKSEMVIKLDKALKLLEMNGFANEFIAEEIEDLKEQLPLLGKKNFFQLSKSKFYDLAINFMITKEVIIEAFKQIFHDFGFPLLK